VVQSHTARVNPHLLTIGEWEADAERNELRRKGESVRLEPKAVEVLLFLARNPGRVVPREELLSAVWPGVVVGDDALTQAIIKLRKALGDDAQEPRYIETIPKRGYRLIAPVEAAAEAPAGSTPAAKAARRRWIRIAAAALLVLAGGVTYLAVQRAGMPWPMATDRQERTPAGSLPLIAVLPFSNLSGDAKRDYLSDGVTEDIIGALGRFTGVRVMSWNSVQAFRGSEPSAQSVRENLRSRYVVRGSVREGESGALRVSVELSDAEKGTQLWSDKYEGQGTQVLDIQDRIVRNVVGALAVKLTQLEQQRAVARPTDNAEAYDLVLRARALLRRDQRVANREARALLARAEAMAPDFAEVSITLGEAEWARSAFGWVEDVEEGVRRAEKLALRALQSPDPRVHARAHSLMATLRTHTGHADEALQHTERAIAINPSDTSALFRHAHALLAAGRPEESIPVFETGLRYEPRPGIGPPSQLAAAYFAARRYDDVISFTQMALAVRPDSFALHAHRAAAYAELGRLEEARREADEVRRLNPAFRVESAGTRLRPEHATQLRTALAKAGL